MTSSNDRRRLCVLLRAVGGRSETFIRRHALDLSPGDTGVVSRYGQHTEADWKPKGPHLVLQPTRLNVLAKLARAKAQNLFRGLPLTYWRLQDDQEQSLHRFFDEHSTEVVLGEYMDLWVDFVAPLKERGLRFFVHAHGYDLSERLQDDRWARLYLRYNEADGVIVPSEVMRRRLLDIGLREDGIHVIPYGVDIPDRSAQGSEEDAVRCVAVGRMVPKKAPLELLEAFVLAHRRDPRLTLDYVGDGELMDSATSFVEAHSAQGVITLHGSRPHGEVLELLFASDMYLQHSVRGPDGDEEGLPVAILEAMSAGLPIVSTRHAAIPEQVRHQIDGLLVDEHDVGGMADAIVDLARSPERRRGMREASRRRATERFSWERERRDLRVLLGLKKTDERGG